MKSFTQKKKNVYIYIYIYIYEVLGSKGRVVSPSIQTSY